MSKLVLIDGHSILTRAFFGVPDLTNSEGLHTNAIYGFLNIMFKILEEEKPEYLSVAFDLKAPTFRHKLFQAYKGTRKPMPKELHEQVPVIKEVLRSMNITVMEKEGFEADDILGTVGKDAVKKGFEVVIVSGDRDLLQLAEEHILIRIPKTKKGSTEIENYYADDVKALYGVSPLEFIDVKALMGDASDNIPGVKSIGEKTASKLIAEYHSIENLYEKIDTVKPERIKNLLTEDRESAFMSKTLATINIEAPVDSYVEDCAITDMFNDKAYSFIRKLDFKTMLSKFNFDGSAIDNSLDFDGCLTEINDENGLKCALVYIKENTLKNNYAGIYYNIFDEIGTVTLTVAVSGKLFYIENNDNISVNEINAFVDEMKKNVKLSLFDLKSLLHQNEKLISFDDDVTDCSICAYLLNPLKESYSFSDCAEEYLGITLETKEEIIGKSNIFNLYTIDRHKYIMLTCSEAYTAGQCADVFVQKLKNLNMYDLYREIEHPVIFVLYEMERNGILVDALDLKDYSSTLDEAICRLEKKIYDEVGEKFNINSPKQLGEILFVKKGLKGGKKTKTGYSTSADILEKLAPEHTYIANILEYRQLTKLKSTYADGLRNYISYDDRIHGKFNQTITATGRLSSTEPNLQNIPIRMEMGKRFRRVFIPAEGYTFIDADYSQIELRILAHMSDDKNLLQAYNSHQDIHSITASQVFHVPLEEVTPTLRSNAKAVNFGIVYGISSFGLSEDLSITKKEAQEYIEKYFEAYPAIKAFLDNTVENAKQDGYVTTLYGRRRPIPELKSSNFMQRQFGERAAMNSAIQGTAADIMKIAMINIYKSLKKRNLKSRIVLQVHDEVLIEAANEELEEVKELVKSAMMNAAQLSVTLEAGISTGKNWLEAH